MGAAAVFEQGDAVDEFCNARTVGSNNLLSRDARQNIFIYHWLEISINNVMSGIEYPVKAL